MMDKEVIQTAYEDALKKVFEIFWKDLPSAKGNTKATKDVEQKFSDGVQFYRDARDRALKLL